MNISNEKEGKNDFFTVRLKHLHKLIVALCFKQALMFFTIVILRIISVKKTLFNHFLFLLMKKTLTSSPN